MGWKKKVIMNIERIIWIFIVTGLVFFNFYIINKYETSINNNEFRILDGNDYPTFSKNDVISLIKQLPNYQGDSITVFGDGTIESSIPELNGGIHSAFNHSETFDYLKSAAKSEKLPVGFIVYRHVVPYYVLEQASSKDTANR